MKLCKKADKIVELVYGKRRGIAPPKVTVIEKKRVRKNDVECIVCRPVCSFPLNLKIIFSLLNKYLTELFDSYFHDCSYAFRKPTRQKHTLQHLNAVEAIRDYRKNILTWSCMWLNVICRSFMIRFRIE